MSSQILLLLGNLLMKPEIQKKEINSMVESARQFYSEYCFTLKADSLRKARAVNIVIQPNLTYDEKEIKLSDINLYLGRHIMAHSMNHKEDKMSFKHTEIRIIMKLFYIDIREEVYVEEDPTKNCVNYPDDDYETYNDCDRQTAMSELAEEISHNFYPIWAAPGNNFSRVTKEPVNIDPHNLSGHMAHVNYASGLTTTACKLPCDITKTVTRSFLNQESSGAGKGISIVFNQDMLVTRLGALHSTAGGAAGHTCPGGGEKIGTAKRGRCGGKHVDI